ncbi:hypothetical protein Glove_11g56 [Diversispora epigaea]|uniref:Mediator of RNA polymerase II transcription subunit 19 n=1 Tax=Diversispora epigaea TaxID=1348612 RepID=A0A397JZ55_9GLOM|nr:hypothetical protein Glove_11g56 [Diversispora epigaea]
MEKFDISKHFHYISSEEKAKNVQQKPEDSAGLSIEYIDIPEETSPIRTEWLESNNKAEILKRYYDRFVKPIVGKEQQLSNIIFTDIPGKPKIMPGNQLRKAIKHQRLRYEKIPRAEPIEWNFFDTKVKGPILGFNPEEYGMESLTLEKKPTQNYNNNDHVVTITESDSSNIYDERSLEKKKKKKHKHDSEHGEKKRKHKKDGEHKRDKDGEHKKKKRKKVGILLI